MESVQRSQLTAAAALGLQAAEAAMVQAYCPYSSISVAAALLIRDHAPVIGVNYESASFGLTLCAERSAIARAQAEGKVSMATGLVLVARMKDNGKQLPPCGACRQWLAELSQRIGLDLPVWTFAADDATGTRFTTSALLPSGFEWPDN